MLYNILVNTINELYESLKHPGHSPQSVHGRRKGSTSHKGKCQSVIDKPLSDYRDWKEKDILESNKTIRNHHNNSTIFNSMTDEEIASIYDYTDGMYSEINGILRKYNGNTDPLNEIQMDRYNRIKGLIDKSKIYEDTILYRGINDNYDGNTYNKVKSFQTGDVWEDNAFMSTSINNPIRGTINLKIRTPKNTPALFIGYPEINHKFYKENEYILPPNTRLYINNVSTDTIGNLMVDATVLPQE